MEQRKQFYRDLGKLMFPIAFQNLMMTLVSATDALVLARVDQNSVAAVSLATEINFVMNLFTGTVISGIAILASQYLGKGDKKTVKNLMAMALRMNVILSLLFFLGAFFAPKLLMSLYTSDQGLMEIGAGYLRIASWSYLLSAVAQAYLCIMKISGGATVCAVITTVTAVVDVAVDIYLVYGAGMGVRGTAISTVAVCAVELLGAVFYSHRKGGIYPDIRAMGFFSKALEQDFWKITLPVLAATLIWGIGYSMSAAVMGHMGADAAAAFSIAALIRNLFTCFIQGMGSGAGVMVGRALGAGELERAKVYGGRLAKTAIACGVLSAALFWLIGPMLSRFFILNDTARLYLNQMLPVCAVYLVAQAITVTVICGVLPAGGDTRFDAEVTSVTMWLVSLPLGWLTAFVLHGPVIVVYVCLCMDEILKIFFVYPRFKKYQWLKNLTRELPE